MCVFFHMVCNISNSNIWTAKHFAQASCTELTLPVPTSLYVLTSLHAFSLYRFSFVKMKDYLTLKNLFEFQKIKYSKPLWVTVLLGDQSVHNPPIDLYLISEKSGLTEWIFNLQTSILKLIFAGYTGSKNPVRNRLKIWFMVLDFSNLILQKIKYRSTGGMYAYIGNDYVYSYR